MFFRRAYTMNHVGLPLYWTGSTEVPSSHRLDGGRRKPGTNWCQALKCWTRTIHARQATSAYQSSNPQIFRRRIFTIPHNFSTPSLAILPGARISSSLVFVWSRTSVSVSLLLSLPAGSFGGHFGGSAGVGLLEHRTSVFPAFLIACAGKYGASIQRVRSGGVQLLIFLVVQPISTPDLACPLETA